MQTNAAEPRLSAGKLAWGLVLIFVGGYAFLEAIDLLSVRELWRLWPVALIVVGAANEVDALRARRSDGSYLLLAAGAWMLAGTQRWLGLSVSTAFPIGFIVAGLFVCLHAVVDDPNAAKAKEDEQ